MIASIVIITSLLKNMTASKKIDIKKLLIAVENHKPTADELVEINNNYNNWKNQIK